MHAADRATALAQLQRVLRGCRVEGVTTNLGALLTLASDPDVAAARVFTRLIDERGERLMPDFAVQQRKAADAAAASLLHPSAAPASPWEATDAWVMQGNGAPVVRLQTLDGTEFKLNGAAAVDETAATRIEADRITVWLDGERHLFDRVSGSADAAVGPGHGLVRAPMPGLILAVNVKQGEAVVRGQALLVMEAMKMEHTLVAGSAGTVAELSASKGARVRDGDLLLRIEQ